jgi:UDP-N-acetylmuramate dehydrogenase
MPVLATTSVADQFLDCLARSRHATQPFDYWLLDGALPEEDIDAVVNNAGAHGGDMAAIVRDAVVLDAERGPQLMTVDDLTYSYRTSALKARADRRFLVLLATFALETGSPARIQAKMDEFVTYRKRTQPPGASLGSIFKNPPGDYAGRLIEAMGLKGFRVGSVQVSPIHANFFVNTGGATASDYHALIRHVRAVVYQQSGIELELEIELLGEW